MPGTVFERGERVTLRTVERDDVKLVQRAHNDPAVRTALGLDRPRNETQVEEYFETVVESDESVDLLVCLDEQAVGKVVAKDVGSARPELSYWLLPDYRGEGYATEAVSLLVDYLFRSFDASGVYARAYASNESSWRLLERLGFEREGRFRNDRFVRGEYRDTVHYGLLREEWES